MEFLRLIILGWYRRYYRIIRVGAGNSALHLKYMYLKPVYPHWRGELLRHRNVNNLANGLSPLAWGTLLQGAHDSAPRRFIPAGAGNSRRSISLSPTRTVYPRWRGELKPRTVLVTGATGLPPLARGTPGATAGSYSRPRFTPAGAGNSATSKFRSAVVAVYPSWRGELQTMKEVVVINNGLPPLARGTRFAPRDFNYRERFTPAGAGNSGHSWCVLAKKTVYPRWRGELLPRWLCRSLWNGLPPLARGTLVISGC